MNLDTGAALSTFPLNFGPDGAGDGRFYRTASGALILDGGAWQFHGYDQKGFAQISEWKTHLCTQSVVQRYRDRLQCSRFTAKLVKERELFLKNCELAWKARTHPSLSRRQHFQFLSEPRSEIHRNQ